MILDKVNDCCDIAFSSIDGVYGWVAEAISIVVVVVVFNLIAKWLLKALESHFEKQKKFFKQSFVQSLYKPISYFVWLFAAVQTVDLIVANIVGPIPISWRHMIFKVAGVLVFTWFLLSWKHKVVKNITAKSKAREVTIDQGKIGAIDKTVTVFIIFMSIFMLMEATDRSVNTLIAFGGVGGLALAFASQEIIANFFGGFMIYVTQPFTIGDWIQLPDHKIEGYVEEIGWYMTRVRSLDKRPIYIPNAIFSKLIVVTPSRMSHRQIKETIGIRYEDAAKIKPIIDDIRAMLQGHADIDHGQSTVVRFDNFGQYSLDIYVRAFCPLTEFSAFMQVKEDVLFKITDILNKHGAQLAFPTQQLMIQK